MADPGPPHEAKPTRCPSRLGQTEDLRRFSLGEFGNGHFQRTLDIGEVIGDIVAPEEEMGNHASPEKYLIGQFAAQHPPVRHALAGLVLDQSVERFHPGRRKGEQKAVVTTLDDEGIAERRSRRSDRSDGVVDRDVPGHADTYCGRWHGEDAAIFQRVLPVPGLAPVDRTLIALAEGIVGNQKRNERKARHRIVPPDGLFHPVGNSPACRGADKTIVVVAADDEQPRFAVDLDSIGVVEGRMRGRLVCARGQLDRPVQDEVLAPGEEGEDRGQPVTDLGKGSADSPRRAVVEGGVGVNTVSSSAHRRLSIAVAYRVRTSSMAMRSVRSTKSSDTSATVSPFGEERTG